MTCYTKTSTSSYVDNSSTPQYPSKGFLTPQFSQGENWSTEREPTWQSYASSKEQTGFDSGFSNSQSRNWSRFCQFLALET